MTAFAIHLHESARGAHVAPHPEHLNHLPPHPMALWVFPEHWFCALLHASNLDWSSISHMTIYMFQCYSLKPAHLHLLSQSPKVCSLYLCLFCCLAYRVVISIFLHSMYYVLIYCIGVSLSDFTVYNRLQFHPPL